MKYVFSAFILCASVLALSACDQSHYYADDSANPAKPTIQQSVPATSAAIPAQVYYFNPIRAGSAGN